MLFGSLHAEEGRTYNAYLLADGGKLIARRLKHELPNYGTFDEKRVFCLRAAARAGDVQGRHLRHPDLRGHLARIGLRASEAGRRANSCWSPMAARTSSTRMKSESRWSNGGSPRPASPSPISIASAGRTSWSSKARASSSTATASSRCTCPISRKRWRYPNGGRAPTAGRAKWDERAGSPNSPRTFTWR